MKLDGVRVVSASDLKTMVEQGTVRVYDFRKKASFVEGHVPGAMSGAPYYDERDTTLDTSFLPSDRDDRVVFYSHGTTGWKSYLMPRSRPSNGRVSEYPVDARRLCRMGGKRTSDRALMSPRRGAQCFVRADWWVGSDALGPRRRLRFW